jgi:saccharopine dehydrogenase (NAD+, L-lysine-forming)
MEADAGVRRGLVAVLGAGGTIAPALVHDLAESRDVAELRLLDVNAERASDVAAAHGLGKADVVGVNAAQLDDLTTALKGADVLVNSASYGLNLAAMEAALGAGCHYVDLGGLYHVTKRQFELDDRFRDANLLAVLGMGASPGKTNVMARLAADRLDEVHALHVSAAASDPTPPEGGLAAPYAIETIFDEVTLPAIVMRDGDVQEVPALTPGGEEMFPEPIGARRTVYTLHSELATFPASFPGLRDASFRLSLAPALATRVEVLAELGLADTDKISVNGATVSPRAVTLAVMRRKGVTHPPSPSTVAVHVVDAEGVRYGQPATVRVEAVTIAHERWGIGGNVVSTATPAAEVARLLIRGTLRRTGVVAPEQVLDPVTFLPALSRTGCRVTVIGP